MLNRISIGADQIWITEDQIESKSTIVDKAAGFSKDLKDGTTVIVEYMPIVRVIKTPEKVVADVG